MTKPALGSMLMVLTLAGCAGGPTSPAAAPPADAVPEPVTRPPRPAPDAASPAPGVDAAVPPAGDAAAEGADAATEARGSGPEAAPAVDGVATSDALSDATTAAPACGPAGVPICLDFESGTLDPRWKIEQSPKPATPEIVIDETRAARGRRALHITIPTRAERYIRTSRPPGGAVLHTRYFLFVSAHPSAHGSLLRYGGRNLEDRWAIYTLGLKGRRLIGDYIQPDPFVERVAECSPTYANGRCDTEAPIFPTGRWVCVQTEMNGAAGASTRVTVDGKTIKLVEVNGSWGKMKSFDLLDVGMVMYQETTPLELWIDDLAIDTKPIPCE